MFMAYKECRCPNCTLPTVFNDARMQCYCINCGFLIRKKDAGDAEPVVSSEAPGDAPTARPSEQSDGLVTVMVSVPDKAQPFMVFIDDEEVLKSTGGSYRVRTTPGRHSLRVRQNLFSETMDIDASEGTRIDVTVGIMGLKINIH